MKKREWKKIDDYFYTEERSACCDAPIKWGDICSQCGEHTEPISEEEWDS